MAHWWAGSDLRKFAAPDTSTIPSTSSISASVIHAASASASTPGNARRLMVSMARTPWMVGRKVSTSTPWRTAQVVQILSAAAMELRTVPSISNSKPRNDLLSRDVLTDKGRRPFARARQMLSANVHQRLQGSGRLQGALHTIEQLPHRPGFLDERNRMFDSGAFRGFEARHDHDRFVWPTVAKLIGQVRAIEFARHGDVRQQQPHLRRVLLQKLRSRIRADLWFHRKTFLLKNFAKKLEDQRVVLNHKNQTVRQMRARRRYWTHHCATP